MWMWNTGEKKHFPHPSAQAYCKLLQQLFHYISPYSKKKKKQMKLNLCQLCVHLRMCVCVYVCCLYCTKTKKILELVCHALAWYNHMENPREIYNDNYTNIWWHYSLGPLWGPVTNTHSLGRCSETSDNQWQSKNSSYQRIIVITFEQF